METNAKKKYTMRDSYIGTINDEFYLSVLLLISLTIGSGNLWTAAILGVCAIVGVCDSALKLHTIKGSD